MNFYQAMNASRIWYMQKIYAKGRDKNNYQVFVVIHLLQG